MRTIPPGAAGSVRSVDILTVHTSDLADGELREIRSLTVAAFEGDFDDHDFEHCLGGMHVLVREAGALVGHGSVVQRRVVHCDRALRIGYVEAVAVRADRRRSGIGGRVMAELERIVDGAYELGALAATEDGAGLYAGRGWHRWPGRVAVLAPGGRADLPEDEQGWTYLWTPRGAAGDLRSRAPAGGAALVFDPARELLFDWRDGDVL
ncbi:GNAT family N-acetyltransferase [Streptomyces sp. NPDC093225]|uniref:GNAT family N-acetyltransferase n=1 Tax=Streptomyces sp. NPDC093225 TaxID=3366034 RepID=UPI0038042375